MRHAKKIAAIFLAVILVFSAVATAFAADPTTNEPTGTSGDTKGKITIENPQVGRTYKLYKIMELQSYDKDSGDGIYTYVAGSVNWKTFLGINTEGENQIEGKYVKFYSDRGYYTWLKLDPKTGSADEIKQAEAKHVQEFAQKAQKYAADNANKIDADIVVKIEENQGTYSIVDYGNASNTANKTLPTGATAEVKMTGEATNQTPTIVIDNIPLGYYLLDSDNGVICSLGTTDNWVTIKDKNVEPTVEKKIFSKASELTDLSKSSNGKNTNNITIGNEMYFRVEINPGMGVNKLVLNDFLESYFDVIIDDTDDTHKINVYKLSDDGKSMVKLDAGNDTYSITGAGFTEAPRNGLATEDEKEGLKSTNVKKLQITFDQTLLDKINGKLVYNEDKSITSAAKLYVTYTAKLNDTALVTPIKYDDGKTQTDYQNYTKAYLKYGDSEAKFASAFAETKTDTFFFDLVKYYINDSNKHVLLPGAKFKMYKQGTDGGASEECYKFIKYTASKNVRYFNKTETKVENPGTEDEETVTYDVYDYNPETITVYRFYDGTYSEDGLEALGTTLGAKTGEIPGSDPKANYTVELTDTIEVTGGHVIVEGIQGNTESAGVYWLKETESPKGYNKLAIRKQVNVAAGNKVAVFDPLSTGAKTWKEEGIAVENNKGALLPETGGIGTILFYVVGGIVVLGAFAVIVIRKRRKSH